MVPELYTSILFWLNFHNIPLYDIIYTTIPIQFLAQITEFSKHRWWYINVKEKHIWKQHDCIVICDKCLETPTSHLQFYNQNSNE